jgi:predicted lipoprotein with Yx(FWY)xxD motif
VTSAQQPTAEGITAQVGSIPAADGGKQITLNGLPIYYYAKDTAAGQASGQGVAGVWYLVAPDGSMVTAGAASGTGTASPSATP